MKNFLLFISYSFDDTEDLMLFYNFSVLQKEKSCTLEYINCVGSSSIHQVSYNKK